ncbi:MAG: hypothetical protein ACJ76Y_27365 [Thermoanaerobaculia bacterium]
MTDLTIFGSQAGGESLEACFFYRSWLRAGGDPKLIQPFVRAWLGAHGERAEARLVFKAWLDAGGKIKYVSKSLHAWLGIHADAESTCSVFRSWLSAGGGLESIKTPVGRWLGANPAHPAAANLVIYLARQKNLPADLLRRALAWCQGNHPAEAALSCLTSLEEHLLREEVADEVVKTSEAWLATVLNQESLSPKAAALVSLLFAILGESPRLRTETAPLFLEWLRHPSSYPSAPARLGREAQRIYFSAQRLSTLSYLDELIASGRLSVVEDREALQRLFTWVKTWTPEARSEVGLFLSERTRVPSAE